MQMTLRLRVRRVHRLSIALTVAACALVAATLASDWWARMPTAFLVLATFLHAVRTAVLRGWPSEHEIRLDPSGVEWRRGARVDAAPWSAVSSVEAREAYSADDHPAVSVKVRAPSGLERTWVDI